MGKQHSRKEPPPSPLLRCPRAPRTRHHRAEETDRRLSKQAQLARLRSSTVMQGRCDGRKCDVTSYTVVHTGMHI